ncbi:MAG: arylsulfatase, partial [Planctomycetaceae bacterium]
MRFPCSLKSLGSLLGLVLCFALLPAKTPVLAQEVLPFPPTPSASTAGLTMRDSVYKKRVEPRRLPADAPNILIILMDDVGPGTPSTYGGEVNTPTLDRVARMGISY